MLSTLTKDFPVVLGCIRASWGTQECRDYLSTVSMGESNAGILTWDAIKEITLLMTKHDQLFAQFAVDPQGFALTV